MGDPAGIGPELAVRAWATREHTDVPAFVYVGSAENLARTARHMGVALPLKPMENGARAAEDFAQILSVIDVPLTELDQAGRPSPGHAKPVLDAIEIAVKGAGVGTFSGLVTNPIHKSSLYAAGFAFPGHTEYLAALTGAQRVVMMLVIPGLRVVPVTVHLALKDAIGALTPDKIVAAGRATAEGLKACFAIAHPRLAIAALNPHAGEEGALGREEIEIIMPAIRTLLAEGVAVKGPAPVDTLFHAEARTRYDAALTMVHDHALIPLKTLDFDHGVNVTLGLPIVRTSPDHGTAFDIAGRGMARPASLIAALKLAHEMAERRAAKQ